MVSVYLMYGNSLIDMHVLVIVCESYVQEFTNLLIDMYVLAMILICTKIEAKSLAFGTSLCSTYFFCVEAVKCYLTHFLPHIMQLGGWLV